MKAETLEPSLEEKVQEVQKEINAKREADKQAFIDGYKILVEQTGWELSPISIHRPTGIMMDFELIEKQ